jgi:hypothetical protein
MPPIVYPGKPVKIFRKEPPNDVVMRLLKEMGFIGFNDLRWFSKEEIRVSTIDEWLPELESYYLPCKAERFLHTWTDSSILTILRHLLHCHGYTLQKEERLYKGAKTMLYQIQPVHSRMDLSGASLQVDFF